MARLPRFNLPGYPQNEIVRGNNRQAIFYGSGDYAFYLRKLEKAIEQYPCQLDAYVLMTNHVHCKRKTNHILFSCSRIVKALPGLHNRSKAMLSSVSYAA